ncbi:MAG TPA: tripartite tricarboxylate transporter substrate binding protein [Geminicoccus sp.]|jgi:putative tricarboxylic transport membrane protein|nr:tripartite tricarboxylate transporter substrate binding protein [Geminicoccus sp.]HEX2525680.1 tripartite tricarboxylate transporter substrate binding protein [Geminicoccus sp.]
MTVRMMRRTTLAALMLVTTCLVGTARAQQMDTLTLIAPAGPGGGWDQTARALQSAIQKGGKVGAVTVENIPGAGGTIGLAQFVERERGQGDSMIVGGLVMLGAILTNNAPVKLDQVTPIARLTGEYEVVVVPASSEFQTLDDLLAALKENPGGVAWGGGSAGGTDHILAGLIAQGAGVDPAQVNYVPFSGGGEALAAVMGGHVAAGISGLSEWVGQIQAGTLRPLAISSPERLEGLDAPTLREAGVDLDLVNWRAIMAPPGIDDAQKQALVQLVDETVKSETWQETLKSKGWSDAYLSGDAFASFLAEEDTRVTAILKSIGLVK